MTEARSARATRWLATAVALVHVPAALATGILGLIALLYASSAPSPWPLLGVATGLLLVAGCTLYGGFRGVLAFRRGAPPVRWAIWLVGALIGPTGVWLLQSVPG